MNRALYVALAGFLAAALPHAADAGGMRHGKGFDAMFKAMDQDGNGEVTQAEVDAFKQARFAEVDADGDGRITLEEATAHEQAKAAERAQERLARMDENKDGAITADEMKFPGGSLIEKADADGSGGVTMDEIKAAWEKHHND